MSERERVGDWASTSSPGGGAQRVRTRASRMLIFGASSKILMKFGGMPDVAGSHLSYSEPYLPPEIKSELLIIEIPRQAPTSVR